MPSISFAQNHLYLGAAKIKIEVANTATKIERGLMFRHRLAKNHGMLFVFPRLQTMGFWMNNTYIPLSIGYFDKHGCLQQVMQMRPATRQQKYFPHYRPKAAYKYALEVNQGWFRRNKIQLGDCFRFNLSSN